MKRLIAVSTLLLLILLTPGCDPFTDVTLVNETEGKLMFYTQDDWAPALEGIEPISPGSSGRADMIRAGYRWLRVGASREDGQWVFDHTYTRDELEKAKRKIVVSSLEPISPPANVKVYPYDGLPLPVLPSVMPSAAPASTPTPGRATP